MKSLLCTVQCSILCVALSLSAASQAFREPCGWSLAGQQQLKMQPSLHRIDALEKKRLSDYFLQFQDEDSLHTLPIVVHVIHTGTAVGSADNPSDANINAMIANLNNAFRKNGPQFGGVDMKIQFQLAVRSPSCGTTPGINRINGSAVYPDYSSGGIAIDTYGGSVDEWKLKALSRWSNTDYINLWIVNRINGDPSAPGGFAYFPELNAAAGDGIVLNASTVDGSNKTVVHEMGHYFGLYHTFHDGAFETTCPANTDCSIDGDAVCDTEPHKLQYDCNNQNECNSSNPYQLADVSLNYTVLNNFMGYTNCAWMFTAGQKARARAALMTFRHGLISSGALSPPPALSPSLACVPSAAFGLSPYYGVEKLEFGNLLVYSNTSLADSAFYVDRTCNQRASVYKGQQYQLKVTSSYPAFNPHTIKAWLDMNNDGDFDDVGEELMSVYSFTGEESTNVLIPLTGVPVNVPLRLRIAADNPAPGFPSFPATCNLFGDSDGGSGQIEDYAVIFTNRTVVSVSSGAWDNPATWSCNCVPTAADHVTVRTGHSVNIPGSMGVVECGKITVENGGTFSVTTGSNFKVTNY